MCAPFYSLRGKGERKPLVVFIYLIFEVEVFETSELKGKSEKRERLADGEHNHITILQKSMTQLFGKMLRTLTQKRM